MCTCKNQDNFYLLEINQPARQASKGGRGGRAHGERATEAKMRSMRHRILQVQPFTNKVLSKISCTLSTYLHGLRFKNNTIKLPCTTTPHTCKQQCKAPKLSHSFSIIVKPFIHDNDHFWAKHKVQHFSLFKPFSILMQYLVSFLPGHLLATQNCQYCNSEIICKKNSLQPF